MDWIVWLGEHFIGMFQAGGETFMGMVTGIVPLLVVLFTFTYALIKFIGEEKVNRAAQFASKYTILRYTLLPLLALLLLTNPMACSFGRFVKEEHKPAFYDAEISLCHPITTFFPYANGAELFVWLGIANGITELGLSTAPLAVRYLLVGLVVILIRGVVTEKISNVLRKRMNISTDVSKAA